MARRKKEPIKVVMPLRETVPKGYSRYPVDAGVTNWDAIPGVLQHAERNVLSNGRKHVPAGTPKPRH